MFTLINLYNSSQLELKVEHNNLEAIFNIATIVNKRNKDELNANKQFEVLEAYIDYKGPEFKNKLMDEYVKSNELLMYSIGKVEIVPLPYELVDNILDMFNIDDMFHFIKFVYKLKPLASLDAEFDEKRVADSLGTRVQTYIKDDYLELTALVQIIKTVVGPIGQFGYMNSTELGKVHNHYVLFDFIDHHIIAETRPFIKLQGLIEKIIETMSRSDEESAIRVIEKQVPTDELGNWVMSVAIIQKIGMSVVTDDTDTKNTITRTYNFVNNKLNNKGDTSNSIRVKKTGTDSDSSSNDPESVLESHRIVYDQSIANIVEMKWGLQTQMNNFKLMDDKIDPVVYQHAKEFTKVLYDVKIADVQIRVLSWIFKDVIDPRAIKYVDIDTIIGSMALMFAYLWCNDFKDMALLLTAMPVEHDGAVMINFTNNRSRLTKELKDELDVVFPYKKVIVSNTGNREVNICEDSINLATNDFYKHRWNYIAHNDYVSEVTGNISTMVSIPSVFKIRLAELILHINKK